MEKALVKIERMPIASMNDLASAGTLLAQSGMFGITSPAAGFVVAATCHSEGISLLEFQRTYHIIDNMPTMKPAAMLARFRERGGKYRIIETSPTRAAAEFDFEKQKIEFEYTMDQAAKAGICYGKNGALRTNWQRFPEDMLWARMTSRAVRRLCPEIVAGVYTPEEVYDMRADETEHAEPVPVTNTTERIAALKSAAAVVPTRDTTPTETPTEAKNPFFEPVATAEKPQFDYGVCPIPGDMHGKRWDEMETRILKIAWTVKHETMEPEHYELIKNLIAERQQGSGKSTD